jgi:hypothetical protein
MNSPVSIYIPRMSAKWTDIGIKNIMEQLCIGFVNRVDFTPINKKPGFGENIDSVVMSAFVHFSDPYINFDNHYTFQFAVNMGNTEFWNTIESEKPYKLQVSFNEYWICLKNKNPVQRTIMNIHQVVENGRHLENLIAAQAEEIENLKDIIEYQDNQNRTKIFNLENKIKKMYKFSEERIAVYMVDELLSLNNRGEIIEREMNSYPDSEDYTKHRELLRSQAKELHREKMTLNNKFMDRFGYSIYYYKDNLMDNGEDDEDYDMEEYERQLEEKENRKFRNHRI